MQRSFLGEIRTMRPCAACRGFGTIIPDPCRECSGDGRVRSRRTLTVKIPPGVDTGTRVQLAGQGEVGPGGGPAGDLYVEIDVARTTTFTRHGDDLLCTVTLPMTAAALGTTLTLPTLEADVDAAAGSGVETSSAGDPARHPVRRRAGAARAGRPRAARRAAATWSYLVVETPTRLDERQEELLRELAALRDEEQPTGQVRPAQVGLRPAARRLQPPLSVPMTLPVFLVPALGRRRPGPRSTVDGRRGPPRGRRTAAAGGRAGRAHRRRGRRGAGDGGREASGFAVDGRRSYATSRGRARGSSSSRRCRRATAASWRSRC